MLNFGLLLLTGFFAIIGMIVSGRLKSKFAKYSKVPTSSGLSGKEIAEKMLRDNDIHDVQVISVEGELTDHYDPTKKTVNLSHDVFYGHSVASAAVAAHECGHAVQHATAYAWLQMRSTIVPAVNFSNRMMNFVFLAMMFFAFTSNLYNQALLVIIVLQAAITVFALITLPVEIDASRRALAWLNGARITGREETEQATDALKWAASTYIVAALAAVASLVYFILQYVGRRD